MKYVCTAEGFDYYLFKPNILHLFNKNFQEMYFMRWIRFAIASLRGSVIYYMFENGKAVGYCLLEPGGGRYTFAEKTNVIIAPYVIAPHARGRGLSELLINTVTNDLFSGSRIWAAVDKDNIPSIRALTKTGFVQYGRASTYGLFRKYVMSEDNGAQYILVYKEKCFDGGNNCANNGEK